MLSNFAVSLVVSLAWPGTPPPLVLPDWSSMKSADFKISGCTLVAHSAPVDVDSRAIAAMTAKDIDVSGYRVSAPSFACVDGRASWRVWFDSREPCVGCYFLVELGDRDAHVEVLRGE